MTTFTVSADPNYQKRIETDLIKKTIERCAARLDAVARATTMDVAKTAFEEAAAIVRELKP